MKRDQNAPKKPESATSSSDKCDLNFHGQCIVDNQDCDRVPAQNSRDCLLSRMKNRDSIHSNLTPFPDAPKEPSPQERPTIRDEINNSRAVLGLPPIQ